MYFAWMRSVDEERHIVIEPEEADPRTILPVLCQKTPSLVAPKQTNRARGHQARMTPNTTVTIEAYACPW